MYEEFYGLNRKPFNLTPDPRFFYPSSKHVDALNSMYYAIKEKMGFVVITGEVGTGKTTVCRTLLDKLEPNTKIAIINNTHITCKQLIKAILDELEIEYEIGTKRDLIYRLNSFLIEQLSEDNIVVVIIDEAQNLTPTVFEEVRMLSNLETNSEKLIQIILMGQPELKAKLEDQSLRQLKQRIAIQYNIDSLTKEETGEYIRHRLMIAGLNGGSENILFPYETIASIYTYAQGIPRLINLICEHVLISGFVKDTKTIYPEIVEEVTKEIGL
jgi:general secretion pathway protein A